MKFFPIIWASLWRRPARTIFTATSVLIAFLLFGSLFGIVSGIDAIFNDLSPDGLRVQARSNVRDALPESYLQKLVNTPGVKGVMSVTGLFDARFEGSKTPIQVVALGGENPLDVFAHQFRLPREQRAALLTTRTGAIVGGRLAEKFGWKIGDRIPVTSSFWPRRDGSPSWVFDIVGIYDWDGHPELANEVMFNYRYLEEARAAGNGLVSVFTVRIADARRSAAIAAAIDDMFVNSSYPTMTRSDRDWIRARISRLGDIEFFVLSIVGAALFTLLFLTGNTMAQSVAERIPELSMLKALGFSDLNVFVMVLSEAVLLCVGGALAGLGITVAFFPSLVEAVQLPIALPGQSIALGVGIALLLALLSSLWPSLRAKRLSVVDGLAGR
jgi:putative ABC transport system permease protein